MRPLCPPPLRRRDPKPGRAAGPSACLPPKRHRLAAAALLAGLLLPAACLPVDISPPTGTPTPTGTPAPTGTIVWFPPSPTATALSVPTATATPDMRPGLGRRTLAEDFPDDSLWDTAAAEGGSAAISMNRLTLAVKPGYYISSMRRELPLSDFYAEITARPSLCRGEDSYGVVVRGVGSSFYRFVLTCSGQVRAERIYGGTRLVIQEPVPSGDAPRPPGEVRIGVWAVGSEMRLFLNGRLQFSVSEPTFPIGAFGVFARSAGEEPVSVTYYDFEVYEVDYVPPTRTPLP